MKLTDLDPQWLGENMFMFKCPHCVVARPEAPDWLTCKNVAMSQKDQYKMIEGQRRVIVLTKPDAVWSWTTRDFSTMSVHPSIDASASGNWHGFITDGLIR